MKNAREIIAAFLHERQYNGKPWIGPDEDAEALLDMLKREGLAVVPRIATPDMCAEAGSFTLDTGEGRALWDDMLTTWLKEEA